MKAIIVINLPPQRAIIIPQPRAKYITEVIDLNPLHISAPHKRMVHRLWLKSGGMKHACKVIVKQITTDLNNAKMHQFMRKWSVKVQKAQPKAIIAYLRDKRVYYLTEGNLIELSTSNHT